MDRAGAFSDCAEIRGFGLDTLCRLFAITPHDRHTAGGDAFLTAQVFLRLLRLGRRYGRQKLARLC